MKRVSELSKFYVMREDNQNVCDVIDGRLLDVTFLDSRLDCDEDVHLHVDLDDVDVGEFVTRSAISISTLEGNCGTRVRVGQTELAFRHLVSGLK